MKRLTLLVPHTHAGQPHAAGDTVTVSHADAEWLLDRRLATLSRNQRTQASPNKPTAEESSTTSASVVGTDPTATSSKPTQPQSADSVTTGDDHEPAS